MTFDDINNKNIYYFAYGMLTDPDYMGAAELVGPAELNGFKFTLYMYANVENNPGSKVVGALWRIDQDLLDELDMVEGYPSLYNRITVPVYSNGKMYKAQVYTMTLDTRKRLKKSYPSEHYIQTIIKGYNHAGLNLDQLYNSLEDLS